MHARARASACEWSSITSMMHFFIGVLNEHLPIDIYIYIISIQHIKINQNKNKNLSVLIAHLIEHQTGNLMDHGSNLVFKIFILCEISGVHPASIRHLNTNCTLRIYNPIHLAHYLEQIFQYINYMCLHLCHSVYTVFKLVIQYSITV